VSGKNSNMKIVDRFSSENLLISICGHLVLLALMVTSFVVVVDRAQLVAPDRIEILEIDLDSVNVGGDETVLYNVGDDTEPIPEPELNQDVANEPSTPEIPEPETIEPEQIVAPSLADVTPVAPEIPEPVLNAVDDAGEKIPTPKKKKSVVRVNREVVSLDRTLTVSVIDALRVAMTRCWVIDTQRTDLGDIRAVAHLTMRRNGTVRDVWFESAARAETDMAFAYVLDTIRAAINTCQPFRMLPPDEFEKWEKIQLTFYPTQGKVM